MTIKASTLFALCFSLAAGAFAGTQISEAKDKVVQEPCRTWLPDEPLGLVTVGGLFSRHLSGVYLDSNTALWAPCDRSAVLFLSSRYHYEDNGQFINSTGLIFRKLLPERDVIIGVNAFYDALHSDRGNDFDQLGLGAEILTRWVDFRFNYYLPDDQIYEVDRLEHREVFPVNGFGPLGPVAGNVQRHQTFRRFESSLEGFNTEIGFLIPGLDRFAEVRIFGGYHHYNNPFGGDFEGFQARLEAHLLPGVIADVEYWDDAALMGGHWTGGVRVSVPFSVYDLVKGGNPFAGITEQFTPRKREFKERLNEMAIRSHRIQTVTSGRILTDQTFKSDTALLAPGVVIPPGGPLGVPLE